MKMMRLLALAVLALCLTLLSACREDSSKPIIVEEDGPSRTVSKEGPGHPKAKSIVSDSTKNKYTWLDKYDIKQALRHQIPCPSKTKRIEVEPESFADWLRYLPLKQEGSAVYFYNGQRRPDQNGMARVVDLDVGERDLQQCADAVMRLRGEYLYSKKKYSAIHFNFTSGHKVAFDDWAKGRKPKVTGNRVRFTSKTNNIDYGYKNFRSYLERIFTFAGTASLDKELPKTRVEDIQIGDIFIQGGFPGHAVLVMDMAIAESTGKRYFLLGQSYMPAQDFHILKNSTNPSCSPWYELPFGEQLHTPDWSFSAKDLHRFK